MEDKYYLLKCDFHIHFAEVYGNDGAKVMVDAYHETGYDCIALTEHAGCIKDLRPEKEAQVYARKKYGADFLVIVGEEVAFDDTENNGEPVRELLALFLSSYIDCNRDSGMDYPITSSPFVSLSPLITAIHKQGGIAILCHDNWLKWYYNVRIPSKKGKSLKKEWFNDYRKGKRAKWFWDYRQGKEIDGWEIGNGSGTVCKYPDGSDSTLSHPRESVDEGYIVLSNSDAHNVEEISQFEMYHTYVFVKERTVEGVKEALLSRRTVAYCNGTLYGREKWLDLYAKIKSGEV